MEVLVINGSPKPNGCTDRALREVESELHKAGITTHRVEVAGKEIRGCIACNYCREHGKCVFSDIVNETAPLLAKADGLLVGTPVYYADAGASVRALMERLFYSTSGVIDKTMKVGAAVASSRRAGSTTALNELMEYFTISAMPVASSTYWNEVHGFVATDVEKDLEGLQTMRNLGRNMAFLIRAIDALKQKEGLPRMERGAFTSFPDGK